ncbi:hypothetical protein FB639_002260 [Coemansia asiatica]|nr:hypothetical protein FB639_002260 [Coemansia asiatica]
MVAGLSLASAQLFKKAPLATNVPDYIAPDQKNDVSDIRYLGYGELIYSGSDAHCTAIMLSNTQALVAASCVQGAASNYQVAVMGANNGYINTAKVQSIQLHKGYDSTTFANNLAILTIDNVYPSGTMRGIIADYPTGWTNRYLVSYSLSSVSPVNPAEPQSVAVPNTNSAACSSNSPLFAANPDDFVCMENTIAAPGGKANCVTGYNAVIGVTQTNIAVGALYSFSVSNSVDGLCPSGGATVLSYYTVLRNYIPWIASVVGQDSIGAMPVKDAGYTLSSAPVTYAAVPASPAAGGMVAQDGFNINATSNEPISLANQLLKAAPVGNSATTVVTTSTEIISITDHTTDTKVVSAQTTGTTSTTTTITDTMTSTTVMTLTETATSMSIVETTVTVTQSQNANGSQVSGNGGQNNIAINLDNGQGNNNNNGGIAQTITVTATATATLSGFTTITESTVTTVTASIYMSASVAANGATTVMAAAATVAPPSTDTVTVTTVSTDLVTSIFTVTAIPTGAHQKIIVARTVISTVTQTITADTSGTITQYIAATASESGSQVSASNSSSKIINAGAAESNATTVDDKDSKSKLSAGAIAGIVIAVLLLMALLGYYIWRKCKNGDFNSVSRVEQWMFNHNTSRRYSDAPTYTVEA